MSQDFVPWPEHAADAHASSQPSRSDVIEARVSALAYGFFCVFAAFSTAQVLESSLHGPSGLTCLFSIYLAFGVSAAAAPWLIGVTAASLTTTMTIGAVPYVLLVAAYLLPARVEALTQIVCVGVGLGAGTLWAAQGTYVGEAAVALSDATKMGVSLAASRLNARFYSIFFLSGVISNSAAGILMISIAEADLAVRALFALLTIIASCGCVIIYNLSPPSDPTESAFACGRALAPAARSVQGAASPPDSDPGDGGGEPSGGAVAAPQAPSPFTVVRFLVRERGVRFLAPTAFATGMGAGFIIGSWMARAVAVNVGMGYVGIAGTVYGLSAVLGMRVWGEVAAWPSWGRRWVFVCGFIMSAAWYTATAAAWTGATDPMTPEASPARVAAALGAIAAFAFTDSIFNAHVNATVQTLYPVRPALTCGIAGVKIAYCAGFSCQQVIAIVMGSRGGSRIDLNALVCLFFLLAAGVSLAWLHTRVAHIDGAVHERADALE
jgi:hypothetical protein